MSRGNRTQACRADLPRELIEQAIDWAIKIHYGPADDVQQQAFSRWLDHSPQHEEAWRRLQSLHDEFSTLPADLATRTLTTFDEQRQTRRRQRRQVLKLLVLGGVLASSGALTYRRAPWQRLFADTATETGQQRATTLEDGSTIRLNTDSAIARHYDASQRRIELLRGEIAVTTGRDRRKRPFIITTPYGTLEALGTRFTVRLRDAYARIDVQDGAVRMQPKNGTPWVVEAGTGGRLQQQKAEGAPPLPYDPTGWTDGVLAVRNMALKNVLSELARYRPGTISCADEVARLPVSGIYHLADTDQVLRFLQQTQPIQVAYRTRYWVTVLPDESRSAGKK
nr:FecR domain-containing protein [uncultured Desulfuromonas sp.]